MMKKNKYTRPLFSRPAMRLLLCCLLLCLVTPPAAAAGNRVVGDVRIIHASSGSTYMDPDLKDLGRELQTVFRYTSYRLLNRKRMPLKYHDVGRISLPGNRRMEISPTQFNQGRIKFKINIFKKNRPVFGTEILLKNGGSITIGGPGYKNGYLLFNISATAM